MMSIWGLELLNRGKPTNYSTVFFHSGSVNLEPHSQISCTKPTEVNGSITRALPYLSRRTSGGLCPWLIKNLHKFHIMCEFPFCSGSFRPCFFFLHTLARCVIVILILGDWVPFGRQVPVQRKLTIFKCHWNHSQVSHSNFISGETNFFFSRQLPHTHKTLSQNVQTWAVGVKSHHQERSKTKQQMAKIQPFKHKKQKEMSQEQKHKLWPKSIFTHKKHTYYGLCGHNKIQDK